MVNEMDVCFSAAVNSLLGRWISPGNKCANAAEGRAMKGDRLGWFKSHQEKCCRSWRKRIKWRNMRQRIKMRIWISNAPTEGRAWVLDSKWHRISVGLTDTSWLLAIKIFSTLPFLLNKPEPNAKNIFHMLGSGDWLLCGMDKNRYAFWINYNSRIISHTWSHNMHWLGIIL